MKRSHIPDAPYDEGVIKKVTIVERNSAPREIPLMNVWAVTKRKPTDLLELAKEIENADNFVKSTACSKLQVIAEQVRVLHKQAHDVFVTAQRDNRLHHAACNFLKTPGKIYHLYKKKTGQEYFSMISPEEWGTSPDQFIGSFRLESDHSFTDVNFIYQRDRERKMIESVLEGNMNVRPYGLLGQLEYECSMEL